MLNGCSTAALEVCYIYIGSFVLVGKKEYFYSLLWILKHNFHAQSKSLKGEFDVLVCEYALIVRFFWEPCFLLLLHNIWDEQLSHQCLKLK